MLGRVPRKNPVSCIWSSAKHSVKAKPWPTIPQRVDPAVSHDAREFLRDADTRRALACTYRRVSFFYAPFAFGRVDLENAARLQNYLVYELGLHPAVELTSVLIRAPHVLRVRPEHAREVLFEFCAALGITSTSDLRHVLVAFPPILSYNVKAHLRPQVHVLRSFGVSDVGALVKRRPSLLSTGADVALSELLRAFPFRRRTGLARLLRTMPLDACYVKDDVAWGAEPRSTRISRAVRVVVFENDEGGTSRRVVKCIR